MPPSVSLVHPTSNPFCRNAALALAEAGLLREVVTTTAFNPNGPIGQSLAYLPTVLAKPVIAELGRRTWVPPTQGTMRTYPWREILRVGLTKASITQTLGICDQRLVDWVYTSLDQRVAHHHLNHIQGIYAYEDGAADTFAAAKQQGILCFYDLPIAFYRTSRAIQTEEAERFPELAKALQAAQEPKAKLARKEQEIQLADHIFVASSMTQRSVLAAGVVPDRISVIPYGAPIDYFYPQPKPDDTFRALFVGRVGPRKGMHYLLQAWQQLRLPQAELRLIGINELPSGWLEQFSSSVHYLPSVPHSTLNAYYSTASVFVFPSLVEGFGLVLLEAMACGIPIITTPNTAGPDLITDGVEGFIIPIRDVEVLKEKLEWCYQHPEELAEMGQAARKKAEEMTWDKYRQNLAYKVKNLLGAR
jgi:starch synthase